MLLHLFPRYLMSLFMSILKSSNVLVQFNQSLDSGNRMKQHSVLFGPPYIVLNDPLSQWWTITGVDQQVITPRLVPGRTQPEPRGTGPHRRPADFLVCLHTTLCCSHKVMRCSSTDSRSFNLLCSCPQGSFRGHLSSSPQQSSTRRRTNENALLHFFRSFVSF